MNRHRKDLGKNRSPRFVQLFHWEIDCPAYKDLGANARAIYIAIKRRYNGSNNGQIPYSAREAAEELGIGKSAAAVAIRELQSHGFVIAEQKGSFKYKVDADGGRKRLASEWRLTAYDSDVATNHTDKLATKEFMRWSKIQNTVRLDGPVVPNTAPYGPVTDTVRAKTADLVPNTGP